MTVLPPLRASRHPDEAVVRSPARAVTPVAVGLLVAAAALVVDQVTKVAADRLLVPDELVEVVPAWVPYFRDGWGWQLVHNPGGPLGLSPDDAIGGLLGEWFFVLVTLLVTVVVIRNLPRVRHPRGGVAHGLLLGGAWGNGLDRILRPPGFPSGQVVDFIAVRVPDVLPLGPDLPRFNIADVAIIAGLVLLLRGVSVESNADAGS